MVNLSHANVICYDLGLFTEQCLRLLRDCASVKYFVPWIDAFPEPFQCKIGDGLDGMERIEYFWDYVDKADLIFIPDTMCADLVEFLKRHHYPVCGVGKAEKIELDRWYGRDMQRENGLPTQETYGITGIEALKEFLMSHKNYYVKLNMFRGLEESFLHIDWHQTEDTFYNIAHLLGPYKEKIMFICEEKMEGEEPGIDGMTWEGELMYPTMGGYEEKGVGIIERVYEEKELPRALLWLNEGLAPEFKKHKTRFFFSAECKIVENNGVALPFMIDPTIRMAAPGTSAIQCEIIKNYSEVVMGMGVGEMVEPVFTHKYGAAMSMDSPEANHGWLNVSFPKEIRKWVKLRMAVKNGSDYYCVPGFDGVGSIVGLDDTIEGAVKKVKDMAEEVKGKRLNKETSGLDKIMENIKKGIKVGINF